MTGVADRPAPNEADPSPAKGAAPGRAGAEPWGEGLAYPEWIARALPAVHDGFKAVNKYVSVPGLRMGLGSVISNPLTGYLMILRTRGRKSGEMRDAPLGYTIVGEYAYCVAGFGRRTHWFQNVLAEPKVEVVLPARSFSGVAEEVTDLDERLRILPPLLRSMGVVAGMVGMGNPWRDSPAEIARKCEGMPLVRVRATGICAGPEDPGGRFWVVPVVVGAYLTLRLLRRRPRSEARCEGSRGARGKG